VVTNHAEDGVEHSGVQENRKGQQGRPGKTAHGYKYSHRESDLLQQTNNCETVQHLHLPLRSAWKMPRCQPRRFIRTTNAARRRLSGQASRRGCEARGRTITARGLGGLYNFLLFGAAFYKRGSARSKRWGIAHQRHDCARWNGLDAGRRIHHGHR
jgi:hypothetical protein